MFGFDDSWLGSRDFYKVRRRGRARTRWYTLTMCHVMLRFINQEVLILRNRAKALEILIFACSLVLAW